MGWHNPKKLLLSHEWLCKTKRDEGIRALRQILNNGFVTIIPILVWNSIFTAKLPAPFNSDVFDRDTPYAIIVGETIFRFAIFLMPLLLRLKISTPVGKAGAGIFLFGLVLYFLSWLVLIYSSASWWSTSVFGVCAPAYTPLVWLVGISLMADSYYFKVSYSRWHFIVPAVCFSLFHILHTAHAFSRMGKA